MSGTSVAGRGVGQSPRPLLQAMRQYGVTGHVTDQRIMLSIGRRAHLTQAKTWPYISEAVALKGGEATIFSRPRTRQRMVMMSLEEYAILVGQLERYMFEAGRLNPAEE